MKYRTSPGQEFVVGGYLPGRNAFTSLLAGYYEEDRLIFIAKLKNGFTGALRHEVARRFRGPGTKRCPFANLPEPRNARRGKALTADVMKECYWLRPELVVLRDDVNPREVHREVP